MSADQERLRSLSSNEKRALLARLLEQDARAARELSLSYGQRALWFLYRMAPDSAAYNVNLAARIRSPIDIDALHRAFQGLVDRHTVLRATFPSRDGLPVVAVPPRSTVQFTVTDSAGLTEPALQASITRDAHRPFALEAGPVFRVNLYARGPAESLLLVSVHHIVYDAVSLAVLLEELGALYAGEVSGRPATLPPMRYQYADFVRWQREMLAGPDGERLWAYWRQALAGEIPDLDLPTDHPRPAFQTFRGEVRVFSVDDGLTARLKAVAAAHEITLFVVLLAAYQVLLHRYADQPEVFVGTPMVGRTRPEFQAIVGYFINPVVLRADLSDDPPFAEFLSAVRRTVLGALAHQDFPFSLLVERLHPDRDTSRMSLFQAMFNMPSAHGLDPQSVSRFVLGETGGRVSLSGLDLEVFPVEQKTAMFDLLLSLVDAGGRLGGSLQYNADLFEASTIERMLGHYLTLLQSIADSPQQRVSELTLLGAAERHRLLVEWNATGRSYPRDQTFAELFEAQAARTPDAVAAVCGDRQITYEALSARANRLARHLVSRGVGPDVVVPILAERNLDFLAAVLAIFKAGGAYLPLDPHHPTQRHAQVLTQSRALLVLTAAVFEPVLAEALAAMSGDARPRVERLEDALRNGSNASNLGARSGPDDLAYVIYTSGSTGAPKGAMVLQRGMVNHQYAKIADLQLTAADVVAQTASQCFDISVWQFLAALLVGGRTHIIEDDVAHDPTALLREVDTCGITVLETVPSLLLAIVEGVASSADRLHLENLRWMIPTGEALSPELCRAWFRQYPRIPMVNAYGPAECSDDVTHHPIYAAPAASVLRVPIGRPIANTRLYILDARLQPVPVGVIGELCVAGDGVGRGYLHDPARTAEAFVPEPFVTDPAARMYRTGDLARHLPDGTIEFLGRRDYQVKVRGFRIELGEIEAVLDGHPRVRECAVLAREDAPGRKRLVAYVAPADSAPAAEDLRGYLKDRLPDYMVPSAFVFLEALPLTPNGKVHRRALPAPAESEEPDSAYVAPRTPSEATLAEIWAQILGLDRVGVHDNFFALGGDSIQSIRILVKAAQAGLHLSLTQFFQYQTVAEQAAAVGAVAPGASSLATTGSRADDAAARLEAAALALGLPAASLETVHPLAPMQFVMLEQTLAEPGSGAYVEQLSATVHGDLDPGAFARAWQDCADSHAVLRTRFVLNGGEPQQAVMRSFLLPWDYRDLRGLPQDEQRTQIDASLAEDLSRGFDPAVAPPLRFALFHLGDGVYHFLWSLHHALLDAWSGGLVLKEVLDRYDALRAGWPLRLGPPPPYRDYVTWIGQQDTAAAEARWRRLLDGMTPAPILTGRDRGAPSPAQIDETAGVGPAPPLYGAQRLALSAASTASVQAAARAQRVTLNTFVQGAWALMLSRLVSRDDVVFGATTSGRPAALAGVESIVGLCINTLPVRARVTTGVSLGDWLRRLQNDQVAMREYECVSLAQVHGWSGLPTHVPLFESVVRFQNFPVEAALRERVGSLRLQDVRFIDRWAYPLCLVAEPGPTLALGLTFDRRRFHETDITALLAALATLLPRMAAEPGAPLADVLAAVEVRA